MSNRKDHLQKQAKKQARIQAELNGQKIQTQEGDNPIPSDTPHGNIRAQSLDIEYEGDVVRVPEPTQEEPDPPKRSRNKSGRRWWEENRWDRKR